MRSRKWMAALAVGVVLVGGALLRGWLVPTDRGDLAPEAYGWRITWPWSPKAEVTVYFPTPDGTVAVAVRRTVAEATPLAALRELAAGPAEGSGLSPALPAGIGVDDVTIADGRAVVTVSGGEVGADGLNLMARTLSGWAEEVAVAGGGSAPVPVPQPGGQVFYLWKGLPVPVAAPGVAGDPEAAVRTLLEGQPPAGVEAMPGGVSVERVEVKGNTAVVALGLSPGVTQELIAGRWQFAPYAMAIVHTLTDQPGIKKVQFDFPDLPAEARRNCRTPLGVPLVRPDAEAGRAKGAEGR